MENDTGWIVSPYHTRKGQKRAQQNFRNGPNSSKQDFRNGPKRSQESFRNGPNRSQQSFRKCQKIPNWRRGSACSQVRNENYDNGSFNTSNKVPFAKSNLITPNNNNNRSNYRPNDPCTNNNVSNISFNENNFISSTAYKNPSHPRPPYYNKRGHHHYHGSRSSPSSSFYSNHERRDTNTKSPSKEILNKSKLSNNETRNKIKFSKGNTNRKKKNFSKITSKRGEAFKNTGTFSQEVQSNQKTYGQGTVRIKKNSDNPILSKKYISNKKTTREPEHLFSQGSSNGRTCFKRVLRKRKASPEDPDNFVLSYTADSPAPGDSLDDDLDKQIKYKRNHKLKFPGSRLPLLNLNDLKFPEDENLSFNTAQKTASPNKLLITGSDKAHADVELKISKKNSFHAGDEFEICENDSSLTKDECVNDDKSYISSHAEVSPSKNILVEILSGNPNDVFSDRKDMVPPPTQSQSLAPSLSIPCGQEINPAKMIDFAPKEEAENGIEHYLNSFFSQMSPPTLSQSQVVVPILDTGKQLSNLMGSVSDLPKAIPINKTKNDKRDLGNTPLGSPSPAKSTITVGTNESSDSSCRYQSIQNDSDNILTAQEDNTPSILSTDVDINASINLPYVTPLKVHSGSKFKEPHCESSPPSKSQTRVTVLEEGNSYLGSGTPPITSTQISQKIKKIYLPDISPLVNVHYDHPQHSDMHESFSGQNSAHIPNLKQNTCTQSFKMNPDDDILKYNSVVNDSVNGSILYDSCTRDFDSIKVKMESLFDVPVSQCTQELLSSLEDSTMEHYDNEHDTSLVEGLVETDITNEDQQGSKMVLMENKEDEENEIHIDEENNEVRFVNKGYQENERSIDKKYPNKNRFDEQNQKVQEYSDIEYLEGETDADKENLESEMNADKENRNSENPRKSCIEEFDFQVEQVLRKLRDLYEKKKRKFLKNKTSTRFEIRIKDVEGSTVSKEVIEFILQDDEKQEDIIHVLSVSVKNTSGNLTERGIASRPFTERNDVSTHACNKKANIGKNAKEKKKKCRLDKSENLWWEAYTEDIPTSIFQRNKESCDRSAKSVRHSSPKSCDNVKTPALKDANTSQENPKNFSNKSGPKSCFTPSRKKFKISKKKKKTIVEALADDETGFEIKDDCTLPEPIVPTYMIPDSSIHKSEMKKNEELENVQIFSNNPVPKMKWENKRYKKELNKTLRNFYKKNRILTPPYQFQKLESQPGRKRPLLSNFDCVWFDT